jgi:four helix bundle protein
LSRSFGVFLQPEKLDKPYKPNEGDALRRPRLLARGQAANKAGLPSHHQNPCWQKDLRLCGQIQSAAGSVMANIAEGFARRSNKEFVQFLFIAISSSAEVQSHLYIAVDQGYVSKGTFDSICN